nr:MAG TPA: protein of unknown function (DUF4116) [Caudoviricetes sp.]
MKLSKIKKHILKLNGENGWKKFKEYYGYKVYMSNEEEQLKRIKENPFTIRFIKNPSEEMQLWAVRKEELTIGYIDNPSEEIQLEAIEQNGLMIKYIDNPSETVQLIAVRENIKAIEYIKNPTDAVLEYILHKDYNELQEVIKLIENDLKEEIENEV